MDLVVMTQLLGNVGEFVGAIAVVVTLMYLTAQVRQARQASTQAIMLARAEAGRDMGLRLAESDYLVSIVGKVRNIDGGLGADEREFMSRYGLIAEEAYRWSNHMFAQARMMEVRFINAQAGDLASERVRLNAFAQRGSFAIWWPVQRTSFDKSFRDEVDSAFERSGNT